MDKVILWLFAMLIIVFCSTVQSQTLTNRVLDSVTHEPIPYATVQLNKKGVITNEEGRFSLPVDDNVLATDSLLISCIGYASLGKPLNEFEGDVIYLSPKAIELNPVVVTNRNYSADEILALVKENLDKNYDKELRKKRMFFRDSYFQDFNKMDYTFVKSTIKELNKTFLDSVLNTVPKKSSYFTEILCDLYGNMDAENQKIAIIKASELYDKSKELDEGKLEEKFNEILTSNIKRDSYFKIKSGWFGTKIKGEDFHRIFESDIDSTDQAALEKELEEKRKREAERKTNFAKYGKNSIVDMMEDLFYLEGSPLDFINKSKKYEYTLKEFTYMGEDAVYILEFSPKGTADYKGLLYINPDDFAIVRLDYENVKSLRKFNLLGIHMNNYSRKGKMIFAKSPKGTYDLRFMEQEKGTTVGIRRPLKIIEKNKHVKGRNKQNELSLKIDMETTGVKKQELIVFDSNLISHAAYTSFTENNSVLPTYMPNYDPEFWKGQTIIEPNQAIRDFTSDVEISK
ncbi:carboxypeptidase-like regulatory domain-containing protein [Maribacter polysaccharolyticus]|uniref:carboxypeptidase-like regulatory domain-containing protein n=1 Tax=Maribacter polysaccharolyticus TaxID=3020831 RepID=UPI00237F5EFB|nr:carboxypeptidase-like regulatory domain-containing protein [Maribacter polysaccharolyticus]MDE3742385.1 carboxypeptidase-like regulatory domain-containing protein [Maribacter polysaccharolyticus]